MELHVQRCQNCDSVHLKNILFRENGEPDRVYVQCQKCNEFVASYEIAPLGYFHFGKGYESFLRGVVRSGEFSSGRNLNELFNLRRETEKARFHKVLSSLEERNRLKEWEDKD